MVPEASCGKRGAVHLAMHSWRCTAQALRRHSRSASPKPGSQPANLRVEGLSSSPSAQHARSNQSMLASAEGSRARSEDSRKGLVAKVKHDELRMLKVSFA